MPPAQPSGLPSRRLAVTISESYHLQDGRRLGYAEFGDHSGRPVFYFHGLPGSRLEARLLDGPARRNGIRVIAVDRPGFGLSDFQAKRVIADWPRDINELADALDLDRFAVVGNSGGGPYAAACARYLAPRLTGAVLVCGLGQLPERNAFTGMAPWVKAVLGAARSSRWLLNFIVRMVVFCLRYFPEQALNFMAMKASPPDSKVLHEPRVRQILRAAFQEAVRQGGQGGIYELQLFTRPWGFRLEEISVAVEIWYGGKDRTVPPSLGAAQAAAIPRRQVHFFEEEGHFSLPVRHMDEIMAASRRFFD
jgi:pimeloyl-ACP methyl ester carboxylesterase